jgi:hypothetical protein
MRKKEKLNNGKCPRLKVSSAVLPIIEINFGKITQSEETVSVFAKDFLYFLNKWVLVDR